MLTAEQFIYKLMEATEESYPEVSQVCYDFLENLSDYPEEDILALAKPIIEQGYIPETVVLKAANAGSRIMVQHDLLEHHIEYNIDGEWKHVSAMNEFEYHTIYF